MTAPAPKKRATKKAPSRATKVRTRQRASKHPWEQIRDHYVTSEQSLTFKEIADVYEIPYNTIKDRAQDERWTYLRADYQARSSLARQQERMMFIAKESLGFDDASLKIGKTGQTLVLARLTQMGAIFQASGVNFDRVLEKIRRGTPLESHELRSPINYKELVELANAADRFQTIGRKALGTDVEKVDISAVLHGGMAQGARVSVGEELEKPDLDRMAGIVEAMRRAKLDHLLTGQLELTAGSEEGDEEVHGDEEGSVHTEGTEDDSEETVYVGEIVQ